MGEPKSKNDILTYTGVRLDPYEIKPPQVDICDIAHSLSFLTRANGHIHRFYSVAQHCVNCAKEAINRSLGSRVALACLLHDAAESYISDVTRPVKRRLKGYEQIESFVIGVIFERYGLGNATKSEMAYVKEIDDAMLYYEFEALADYRMSPEPPRISMQHDFSQRAFEDVEGEYLALFHRLIEDVEKQNVY